MADLLDLETALATLCGAAIYPQGTGFPAITGIDCKIFPGWPNASELATTLGAGVAEISIYSGQNLERDTTRFARNWFDITVTPPTITATVAARTITLGGTITTGHFVTLLVDGIAYSYAALATDTLATVAVALAALLPSAVTPVVAGSVITLAAAANGRITARTAAPGLIGREIGRQQRGLMISVWAPSPQSRSAISAVLMKMVRGTDFVTLPDTTTAWMTYRQSNESDGKENAMAYRRDINVWMEYATIETAVGYPITAPVSTLTVNPFVPSTANPNAPTGAVVNTVSTSSGSSYTASDPTVNDAPTAINIIASQLLTISKANGNAILSTSTDFNSADVAGIATANASPGFRVTFATEKLILSDWTAATGQVNLLPGFDYFLGATPGTMTTTPPTIVGQTLLYIGTATNTTTLSVAIATRILL